MMQAITIDSRVVANAPPRIILGQRVDEMDVVEDSLSANNSGTHGQEPEL